MSPEKFAAKAAADRAVRKAANNVVSLEALRIVLSDGLDSGAFLDIDWTDQIAGPSKKNHDTYVARLAVALNEVVTELQAKSGRFV